MKKFKLNILSLSLITALSVGVSHASVDINQELKFFEQQSESIKQAPRKSFEDLKIAKPDDKKVQEIMQENQKLVQKIQKDGFAISSVGGRVFDDVAVKTLKAEGEEKLRKLKEQDEQSRIVDTFDTLIFISYGMDEQTLKQLYQINAGNKHVALVVRGLVRGTTTIEDTVRVLQKIAVDLKLEVPPTVLINPVWFKQYHITSVPTIVKLNANTSKKSGDFDTGKELPAVTELARVQGIIDPAYLTEQIVLGKKGDLGVKGPVTEIQERDLIEELQERTAKINWAQKAENAKRRAWKNIPIEPLEHATTYRKRLVDPTVTIQKDIIVDDPQHKGEKLVVARKGDKLNPLEFRPFDRLLVVFNPTIKTEVDFVAKHLDTWIKQSGNLAQNTRLLITDMDRSGGWNEFNGLIKKFDKPVFVLVPEVKKTFVLERTPAIVYAQKGALEFVVEEFNVDEKLEVKKDENKSK